MANLAVEPPPRARPPVKLSSFFVALALALGWSVLSAGLASML
jgi:hypothetical protein